MSIRFKSKAEREADAAAEASRRAQQREEEIKKHRAAFMAKNNEPQPGSRDAAKRKRKTEQELEREMMKEEKLVGVQLDKRIIEKPIEAARRKFSYHAQDDTTKKEYNSLYKKPFVAKSRASIREKSRASFEKPRGRRRKKRAVRGEDTIDTDNRHWSAKNSAEMTDRDWRIFNEDNGITVRGGQIPRATRTWEEMELPETLLQDIRKVGYKAPSAIQMQAVPCASTGRDCLGIAQTGSGKTAAFVIPMLRYIGRQPPMTPARAIHGPYALVMAPVRELAIQIQEEISKLSASQRVKTCCVVGGIQIEEQASELRTGVHIVIATPGRLIDLLKRQYIVLNQCHYLVLDEADRMLEMGFDEQVDEVLEAIPAEKRTTMLFSATMPPSIERLARTYMVDPITIMIGVEDSVSTITQTVVWVTSEQQRNSLLDMALHKTKSPIIIFCNERRKVDQVAEKLKSSFGGVTTLHGGKNQLQRNEAIEGFREGKFQVLVATNVAGRGIDIPGIQHVINYDCPGSLEDYKHRIGRTGRAGASGLATTFLGPNDSDIFYHMKRYLRKANARIPHELNMHAASNIKPGTLLDHRGKVVRGGTE